MSYTYDDQNIFAKILRGEIPNTTVLETAHSLAFRDLYPQAPTHVLVIPKKPIPKLVDSTDDDQALLGHLILKANHVAREAGIGDAFRLVVNNGAGASQTVFHLHVHVLGGRGFSWPPG